jgi:hypothetical protein
VSLSPPVILSEVKNLVVVLEITSSLALFAIILDALYTPGLTSGRGYAIDKAKLCGEWREDS